MCSTEGNRSEWRTLHTTSSFYLVHLDRVLQSDHDGSFVYHDFLSLIEMALSMVEAYMLLGYQRYFKKVSVFIFEADSHLQRSV